MITIYYDHFLTPPPHILETNNKRLRARQYPWGFAEIENNDHCDFSTLRKMLLQTHMQDLIDTTATLHYENFRQRKLSPVVSTLIDNVSFSNVQPNGNGEAGSMGGSGENDTHSMNFKNDRNPIEQIEDEKRTHKERMQQMEREMEQVFQLKVKEKKKRLQDSEMELQRRHETMQKKMNDEWEQLDMRRRAFEENKRKWEDDNKVHLDKLAKTKTKSKMFN